MGVEMKKIVFSASVIVAIVIIAAVFILRWESAGRKTEETLETGNIEVPVERSLVYNDRSLLQQKIINYWTCQKTSGWKAGEKVGLKNSRTVLGCLVAGKRVKEMNQYLLGQKSTGTAGSRWLLNPKGGYNFNTMACTPILYLFDNRSDLLYPETKEHLANNILTIEGDEFTRYVPYLPIQDSENHILMAESSRYLKNRWLWENGEKSPQYDNENNGVKEGLMSFLKEIYEYGFYEFNSDPYLGYSYCSLLNLYEFADDEIKLLTEKILDRLNWQYALSSYKFKHFPPYRRKFVKKFKNNLDSDYHTVMLKVWCSLYSDTLEVDISRGKHHALWASVMSYRPPDKVLDWTLQKPAQYFVKMGHGYNSCPEIYSGDKSYLLSAGGANLGRNSLMVPKPTILFLDDNASELEQTFHMYGPGKDLMDWNNTGVYIDFACTKGKVHIPAGKSPVVKSEGWQVFTVSDSIFLNVFSGKELGLMVIVRSGSASEALDTILKSNPDPALYNCQFRHPNGNFIEYDLDAPKNMWVIKKINNKKTDREFDKWPLIEGNI